MGGRGDPGPRVPALEDAPGACRPGQVRAVLPYPGVTETVTFRELYLFLFVTYLIFIKRIHIIILGLQMGRSVPDPLLGGNLSSAGHCRLFRD